MAETTGHGLRPEQFVHRIKGEWHALNANELITREANVHQDMVIELLELAQLPALAPIRYDPVQSRKREGLISGFGLVQDIIAHGTPHSDGFRTVKRIRQGSTRLCQQRTSC